MSNEQQLMEYTEIYDQSIDLGLGVKLTDNGMLLFPVETHAFNLEQLEYIESQKVDSPIPAMRNHDHPEHLVEQAGLYIVSKSGGSFTLKVGFNICVKHKDSGETLLTHRAEKHRSYKFNPNLQTGGINIYHVDPAEKNFSDVSQHLQQRRDNLEQYVEILRQNILTCFENYGNPNFKGEAAQEILQVIPEDATEAVTLWASGKFPQEYYSERECKFSLER